MQENKKWWVLATVCLLTAILNFDLTGVNLAVPKIASELHASLANMQWVLNAYVLTSGMFTMLGGRLGDKIGYRRIFIFGTLVFVLVSLIAGFSHTEYMLIASRALQGFALGMAYPMTIVLATQAFPREQQGLAMGFIVGTMGLSMAVGPTLGGVILSYLGWRWIFLLNIPVGILTILFTLVFCEADKVSTVTKRIDFGGFLLLSLGILGVILALNQSQVWGLSSLLFIGVLSAGVILLLILFFTEKSKSDPFVNFTLFKIRNFSLNTGLRFVSQVILLPVLFFVLVYLQNILNYSAMQAGVIVLFLTLSLGATSPFIGRWVDAVGVKTPAILSMLLYAVACVLLYQLSTETNFFLLGGALILTGFATSIIFVSTNTGALAAVPSSQSGMASGLFFTIAWISNAVGLAITGSAVAVTSKNHLLKGLLAENIVIPENINVLERMAEGIISPGSLIEYFPAQSLFQLNPLVKLSFISGFSSAAIILFCFSILGLFYALAIDNRKQ